MSHPYKNKSAEKVGHARAKAICKQDGGAVERGYLDRVMRQPEPRDREALHSIGRGALRQRFEADGEASKRGVWPSPAQSMQQDMAEDISRAVPRGRKSGGRLPSAGAEGGLGRLQLSKIQKSKRT